MGMRKEYDLVSGIRNRGQKGMNGMKKALFGRSHHLGIWGRWCAGQQSSSQEYIHHQRPTICLHLVLFVFLFREIQWEFLQAVVKIGGREKQQRPQA